MRNKDTQKDKGIEKRRGREMEKEKERDRWRHMKRDTNGDRQTEKRK